MSLASTDYDPYDFANRRHIGPAPSEISEMLSVLGCSSLDALIDETVPRAIRQEKPLSWAPLAEHEFLTKMRRLARSNRRMISLIGQGYYGTVTPPAIQRNILENPAWYSAYTPYQPEIAQGRLEALLNFQTMVSDLTGLPIANASLLDEATAAAEAMAMARAQSKSKSQVFFADEALHPQTLAVLKTRARPLGIEVVSGPVESLPEQLFGAIFQYPGTLGHITDPSAAIAKVHAAGGLVTVATDLMALCVIKEPGAVGADIAIGSTQRFGVQMGFGGPHAAFMSCRDEHKRSMPGRIVGVSVDSHGNRAYRLALQTREQHIRREKATSNVCTAQALLAVIAGFYAVFHGPSGLYAIASRIHKRTARLAAALRATGATLVNNSSFFDTLTVDVGIGQTAVLTAASDNGILLRKIGKTRVGISVDETTTDATLNLLLEKAFGSTAGLPDEAPDGIPGDMLRQSDYLTHPIFHMNRAESEMMRYMRRLSDRDLALDRSMIPLGSCTMKLNAAAEMMPITWPDVADVHPYAPRETVPGYMAMLSDLEAKLCEITGYDAFSMQPNSGAQGEYAGLLTILNYHRSRGDDQRKVCLIPMSAHGTNPASAQMAGMKVVVVKSTATGDIDLDDFRAKAEAAGDKLAACMITYPSTHGVFEDTVREVCAITHEHGGQVYLDGANLNAMVGLVQPGAIGGDVSHLNLHKTFAIPHGGGGPGMGPIGVKSHLVPFLPGDPQEADGGAVSASAFGSGSILIISWGYIQMMGGEGLTQATRVAILNANYIAERLRGDYQTLYLGNRGRCAHECILDTRPFAEHGVSVDDIAKRLIDNGFHAPTMSWPVTGTLMVEPTESETKGEIDRFITAMRAIRAEIADIADGKLSAQDSPLHHAPHTAEDLVAEKWDRPYSREQGCFPPGAYRVDKYWPPVGRVDNAAGDRNLICTCPPLEEWLEAGE